MNYKQTVNGLEVEIIYSENAKKERVQEGIKTWINIGIEDKSEDLYDVDIHLPSDWKFSEFTEVITQVCLMCDDKPKRIIATFLGNVPPKDLPKEILNNF